MAQEDYSSHDWTKHTDDAIIVSSDHWYTIKS